MKIKSKSKLIVLVIGIIFMLAIIPGKVLATDSIDVKASGTLDYTKAQEVLEIVNSYRKEEGLTELKMDQELLEAAMQRAVEIGIDFSHTRPDGTSCFSLSSKMYGENIAAGRSTATGTMDQWMNSSGHKANILNSSYNSIGIGCFKNGNVYYWVQCFGIDDANTVSTKKGTTNVTKTVSVLSGNVTVYAYTVKKATNANYMKVTETGYFMYGINNAGWSSVYSVGVLSDYSFSSSNTNVITIDSKGNFKAVGEGTATVSVYLKSDNTKSFSEKITVKRDDINKDYLYIYDLETTYKATGKAIKPKPTIYYTMSNKLVEGTDYKLTYSNNVNAGTATITIKGIGKYKGTVTKKFYIAPKKVSGVANKTQTTTSITVKWSKSAGASGYEIYKYDSSKKKYVKLKTTTSTSYKVTGLKAGTTYKFKVRAYKTINGKKYYGSYSSVTSLTTKTKTPTIKSTTAGSKKATIKWSKVSGATGYEVYMATSKNGKYSKVKTITKGSTVKYTKSSLKKGKTYYFKIRTYRTVNGKKVYSSYSSIKSVKVK